MIAGVIQNGNIDLGVIEAEWSREIAERVRHAMVCKRVWTFLDVLTVSEREFWAHRTIRRGREVSARTTIAAHLVLKNATPSSGGVQ